MKYYFVSNSFELMMIRNKGAKKKKPHAILSPLAFLLPINVCKGYLLTVDSQRRSKGQTKTEENQPKLFFWSFFNNKETLNPSNKTQWFPSMLPFVVNRLYEGVFGVILHSQRAAVRVQKADMLQFLKCQHLIQNDLKWRHGNWT